MADISFAALPYDLSKVKELYPNLGVVPTV
jgi:hypothetical protein